MKRTAFGFIRLVGGDFDGWWTREAVFVVMCSAAGAFSAYQLRDDSDSEPEPVLRLVESFSPTPLDTAK